MTRRGVRYVPATLGEFISSIERIIGRNDTRHFFQVLIRFCNREI
jgi:hypothetical protein